MNGKRDSVNKCIFVKAIFMISMFHCQSYIVRYSAVICLKLISNNNMQCHVRKDTLYGSFYNLFLIDSLKYFRS